MCRDNKIYNIIYSSEWSCIFPKLMELYKKCLCGVLFQRMDFRLWASVRENITWQFYTRAKQLNKDIFAKFISNNFNHCIDEGKFPYEIKHSDVIPVHKKKDKCAKENYRLVSILKFCRTSTKISLWSS